MPPMNDDELEELEQDGAAEIPSGLDDDDDELDTSAAAESEPAGHDSEDDDEPLTAAEPTEDEAEPAEPAPAAAEAAPEPADEPADEELEEEELESEPFDALEGALHYRGQGVFVPEGEALERFRQQLGLATRAEAEIEQLRTMRSAEAQVAADVIELVFKDFPTMDEDALYDWAVKTRGDLPRLQQELRQKYLDAREAEIDRREKGGAPAARAAAAAPDPAAEPINLEQPEIRQAVETSARQTLAALWQRPELAALTKGDRAQLEQRALERLPQLTKRAADDTFAEHGIRRGDGYFDANTVHEWALDRAAVRAEERQRHAAANKVMTANRRKLGTGKAGGAPAAVSGGRTTGNTADAEWKPAESREEWLRRMEAD